MRKLTGDFWPSELVAALFAVHPLHVESVAWVAERKDVLSGLFFMLTLWMYAGYVSRPFSLVRYLAVAATFALGLMAKPTLVTLPLVLLLLDWWPLGRFRKLTSEGTGIGLAAGKLVVEKIPLLLLSAASCVVTLVAQRITVKAFVDLTLPWRIGNAVVACVDYLIQTVCPVNLAVMYPHLGRSLPIWRIAAATAVLAAICGGGVLLRRRCPYLVTGWLWYLGMLVPMIGLVQVGWQSRADRYMYLPQIGVCIMAAWGIRQAAVSPAARRWAFVGASAALAILVTLAYRQTAVWRSDEALWRHAVACTDNNCIAYLHVGMALSEQEHFDKAIEQYRIAERLLKDGSVVLLPVNEARIANSLGYALWKLGRLDEAIVQYERAASLEPTLAISHINLGGVLQEGGRLDEAIAHCKLAIKIDPNCAPAHNNLGAAMLKRDMLPQAIWHFQQALALRPDVADTKRHLASAMERFLHSPKSIVRWRDWIDLWPNDCMLLNNAAWLMATSSDASLRNGKDAVELAQRATRLLGRREPITLATLAAAYAEAGRFPDAARTAREALALARQQGNSALVNSIEEKLRLYESRKPYHEPPGL